MTQFMVVGYKGEIGSFILNGLLRVMPKALNIWCSDVNETDSEVADRIKVSDVIFLCVPVNETSKWFCKYENLLKDKIIIEQCSRKTFVYNDNELFHLDIRSMHILYRPSQTPNLDDRRVGLFKEQFDDVLQVSNVISLRLDEMIEKITESTLVWYDGFKHHDTEMAVQQALLHRLILITGKMLRAGSSQTYLGKKIIELEDRIRDASPDLYKQIQENEYLPEMLNAFADEFADFNINEYLE